MAQNAAFSRVLGGPGPEGIGPGDANVAPFGPWGETTEGGTEQGLQRSVDNFAVDLRFRGLVL